MKVFNIDPVFSAFIRPEDGANVGLIRTLEGMVLIDTASSPAEIRGLLDAAGVPLDDIRMVINTHYHTDHTWGNQLFSCPIVAHRLCRDRMESNLRNEWSLEAFQKNIASLLESDPVKAEEFRNSVEGLKIKLPDQVFEDRFDAGLGDVVYQVLHLGGHTPDTSIVWLPENRILYASDLIFQGRYPYVFDADIPAWIEALMRLLEFKTDVIIPGHGTPCSGDEIRYLIDYLQNTWQLTGEHVRLGHSIEQTCADPAFPVFAEAKKEKLHTANIRYMYSKITG